MTEHGEHHTHGEVGATERRTFQTKVTNLKGNHLRIKDPYIPSDVVTRYQRNGTVIDLTMPTIGELDFSVVALYAAIVMKPIIVNRSYGFYRETTLKLYPGGNIEGFTYNEGKVILDCQGRKVAVLPSRHG